jgi:hypothetical protein
MVDKLSKYVGWVLYVLMAVSAVLAILFYTNSLSTDNFIQWGYVLIIASVIIAVISPIYGFILAPRNAIKLLIILGLVAVVAFIAYSVAGNTFSETRLDLLKIDAQTSRLVGMGLYFTYFAFAASILAIIFSSVIKIFK